MQKPTVNEALAQAWQAVLDQFPTCDMAELPLVTKTLATMMKEALSETKMGDVACACEDEKGDLLLPQVTLNVDGREYGVVLHVRGMHTKASPKPRELVSELGLYQVAHDYEELFIMDVPLDPISKRFGEVSWYTLSVVGVGRCTNQRFVFETESEVAHRLMAQLRAMNPTSVAVTMDVLEREKTNQDPLSTSSSPQASECHEPHTYPSQDSRSFARWPQEKTSADALLATLMVLFPECICASTSERLTRAGTWLLETHRVACFNLHDKLDAPGLNVALEPDTKHASLLTSLPRRWKSLWALRTHMKAILEVIDPSTLARCWGVSEAKLISLADRQASWVAVALEAWKQHPSRQARAAHLSLDDVRGLLEHIVD